MRAVVHFDAPAIAALGGACARLSDAGVAAALSAHHKRCRYTIGLTTEVASALTSNKPLAVTLSHIRSARFRFVFLSFRFVI